MAAWWYYEDHRYQIKDMIACAGRPPEEVLMQGVTYDDIRPGCYEPKARLEDMDENQVEASLCFPSMKLLDEVGVDNVMFETDYPHSDGTFPHSRETAMELFGHLDDDVVHKLARGNAIKLLDLPFAD